MKKNYFVLAALVLLLVWLPIFTSCENAASDSGGGPGITGYVPLDDETVSPPALPPQRQLASGPVNPPGLEIEITKRPDGSTAIDASGDVGTEPPNDEIKTDFGYNTLLPVPGPNSTKYSTMVLTGIVDPTKPGTIKQYNVALNNYNPPDYVNFKNIGKPNVYKEKYYLGGPDSYYDDSLGGFDILLWEGANPKIITLYVTQDGVTKTYIIDYSDVVFQ
ncbi:MAG: hypothetical protein LBO65_05645 [Spirochaetaceae bacterium]|jgi:hypothetical protein|nr:hypothetical protein [Spirochaetaceae bacterium]